MAKTVLITGASQGIGAALAKRFAEAGYNAAINCYNEETRLNGGERVAEECRAFGVMAECFVADVSDFEAAEAMTKAVRARFGAIDVLINNAGITRDGPLVRMSEKSFDDVIAANLKGTFNMCRHAGAVMMRQKSGSIVNMASVAGVYGNAGQANYAASKAGVIGLTKTVARELGSRGVTCNAIAPGIIQTAMTDVLPQELKDKYLTAISLRRFGTVEDVARAALFLAEAEYVTAQVLLVDGGLQM
jgi:3-oxoacyl-[acyl-carrier protein] reductase